MRAFLGFVTFASLASQKVSGHHRILVIQVQVRGQARRPEHASEQELLPLRAPGAQGPPFPVLGWKVGAPGWTEPEPETMRRVAAALRRL
jgi:hypothetical protein